MGNNTTVAFLVALGLLSSFTALNKTLQRYRLEMGIMMTLSIPGALLIYLGFNPDIAQ